MWAKTNMFCIGKTVAVFQEVKCRSSGRVFSLLLPHTLYNVIGEAKSESFWFSYNLDMTEIVLLLFRK